MWCSVPLVSTLCTPWVHSYFPPPTSQGTSLSFPHRKIDPGCLKCPTLEEGRIPSLFHSRDRLTRSLWAMVDALCKLCPPPLHRDQGACTRLVPPPNAQAPLLLHVTAVSNPPAAFARGVACGCHISGKNYSACTTKQFTIW